MTTRSQGTSNSLSREVGQESRGSVRDRLGRRRPALLRDKFLSYRMISAHIIRRKQSGKFFGKGTGRVSSSLPFLEEAAMTERRRWLFSSRFFRIISRK